MSIKKQQYLFISTLDDLCCCCVVDNIITCERLNNVFISPMYVENRYKYEQKMVRAVPLAGAVLQLWRFPYHLFTQNPNRM